MAVTMTVAELLAALRLGDSAEETAEVTRLLAYATEAVQKHAPNAADTAMNEAVRRLGGYLFDMPEAGRGRRLRQRLEEQRRGANVVAIPHTSGGLLRGVLICQRTVESPST